MCPGTHHLASGCRAEKHDDICLASRSAVNDYRISQQNAGKSHQRKYHERLQNPHKRPSSETETEPRSHDTADSRTPMKLEAHRQAWMNLDLNSPSLSPSPVTPYITLTRPISATRADAAGPRPIWRLRKRFLPHLHHPPWPCVSDI